MNQSFLIFGREPGLSFAELCQYLGENKQNIALADRAGAIVNDESLSQDVPEHLGGVIKSGEIIKTVAKLEAKDLADILRSFIKVESKFHFGLSSYNLISVHTTPGPSSERRGLKPLGLEVKKILKETGVSVRLVESRSKNLSAVDVVKNRLLKDGAELCIFSTAGGFIIGKTEAVQPYEDYSARDYGRPGRDAKSGMLPPKLAMAMINMAVGAYGNMSIRILDPFCGSGTVLQEALLKNHNVIGTDIEGRAVANARKNIEWLLNQIDPSTALRSARDDGASSWRVEQADARQIGKLLSPQSVDAIVTEFDLGPPLLGGESINKIKSIVASLSDFYVDALRALRSILKDSGRATVAWPYWREHKLFITAFDKLKSLGWELALPYPKEYQNIFPLSERGTLLYGREGQHVGREILILKKMA